MQSDWLIDVLNDLKTFARENEMDVLAEQLADVYIVALAEIGAKNIHVQNSDRSGALDPEHF